MKRFVKKVLFYGDSNTYGYDPAGFMGGRYPKESRWTEVLQTNLRGLWRVVSDGEPGRGLPAAGYEWAYLKSVLEKEAPIDLFAVMLGTNDILGTTRPDAERAAGRMEELISFVKEYLDRSTDEDMKEVLAGNRSLPGILLIAPPSFELSEVSFGEPYVAGGRSLAQAYREEAEKFTARCREIAEREHLFFADASAWDLPLAFDGVHLSEGGNMMFAAEMIDVLRHIWNGSGHSCEGCTGTCPV